MNIKDIAYKFVVKCDAWGVMPIEHQVELLTEFVAELAKENKPVLVLFQHDETGRTTSVEPSLADDFERMNKRWYRAGNLYTNPPTAEQIEQETVEACAKLCEEDAKGWLDHSCEMAARDCEVAIRSGKWREYK